MLRLIDLKNYDGFLEAEYRLIKLSNSLILDEKEWPLTHSLSKESIVTVLAAKFHDPTDFYQHCL